MVIVLLTITITFTLAITSICTSLGELSCVDSLGLRIMVT